MKLKDCTKEELIFVIERLGVYTLSDTDYYVQRALDDVEDQRNEKKRIAARRLASYSAEKMREYVRLLAPYDGRLITDMPLAVLEQADAAMKEAHAADAKWMKLMGIKSAPAKK